MDIQQYSHINKLIANSTFTSRISGSLIGRALGIGFVQAYRITTGNPLPTGIWAWIDPGVMAAVGAGALLSGVNRLEVASTVILVGLKSPHKDFPH